MDEVINIFTESTENMGLMYNSYEPILGTTLSFLDTIEKCVDDLRNKPTDVNIDLSKHISDYKDSVNKKFTPSPIEIGKIGNTIKTVKKFKSDLDSMLSRFVKLKNSIAFGGNYLRAVINRPKVYSKEIDEDKYAKINSNIRNVNRAMDWVEKVMIDLFNMADQDLNILTIVNRVYAKKKIYEGTLPAGIATEDVADSVIGMLPGAKDPSAEPINEAPWVVNTRDKKTGGAATYISRNHDMSKYGEDDSDEEPKKKTDDDELSLDDYRRPSAAKNDESDLGLDDPEEKSAGTKSDGNGSSPSGGGNNYYYYTYNNSLNKNTGSFNKDHSFHDDHSTHNVDRSSGKHINSHNTNGAEKDDEDKEKEFHSLESAAPWELNIPTTPNVFTESSKADRKFSLFGVELEVPESFTGYSDNFGLGRLPDEYREKAMTKFLDMIHDESKIKQIEDDILSEERQIGEKEDTDEIRIERIKTYLSQAKPTSFTFGTNFNAKLKIDIPYIKNVVCAWLEHELWITTSGRAASYDAVEFYENVITEEVGDVDDNKPESDHPVKDIFMDIDRSLTTSQQKAKKTVQNVQNAARAAMKPVNRAKDWIGDMVGKWKDADETNIKERMADPHARSNLFSAIKKAVMAGSLLKAGLLLNPVFLFLTVTRGIGKNKREFRLRNEMIGEIKTEIKITEEKIRDADQKGDNKAKYQLMRFKNELNKKLLRVGGGKGWSKMI